MNMIDCRQNEEYTSQTQQVAQSQFNPYTNNHGTVVAVGGKGFCIIAGDTRLSEGYSVLSRNSTKILPLTKYVYMASSGMYADFLALSKSLQAQIQMYQYQLEKEPTVESLASVLSLKLYGARFFPYYTFNLLAGLTANGDGYVCGYDAIGSYDTNVFIVQGSGQEMMVPILDNQLIGEYKKEQTQPQSVDETIDLIVECFNAVAERDIYTGDGIEMVILEHGKEPVKKYFNLRKD